MMAVKIGQGVFFLSSWIQIVRVSGASVFSFHVAFGACFRCGLQALDWTQMTTKLRCCCLCSSCHQLALIYKAL